jgi:hypothetical protein
LHSLEEYWSLAREDAGFSSCEARLYVLAGQPAGTYWAMYVKPGDWLLYDENFSFSDSSCATRTAAACVPIESRYTPLLAS